MTKYLEEEFKTRLHKVIECIKSYDIEYLEIGIFGSYAREKQQVEVILIFAW